MGICMRIAVKQSMAIARAHLAGQPGRAAGINCWGGPPGRPTGISVSLHHFCSKPYQGLEIHTLNPYLLQNCPTRPLLVYGQGHIYIYII